MSCASTPVQWFARETTHVKTQAEPKDCTAGDRTICSIQKQYNSPTNPKMGNQSNDIFAPLILRGNGTFHRDEAEFSRFGLMTHSIGGSATT